MRMCLRTCRSRVCSCVSLLGSQVRRIADTEEKGKPVILALAIAGVSRATRAVVCVRWTTRHPQAGIFKSLNGTRRFQSSISLSLFCLISELDVQERGHPREHECENASFANDVADHLVRRLQCCGFILLNSRDLAIVVRAWLYPRYELV